MEIFQIHMFPFDVQNCTMHVGSWMYTRNEMDVFYTTPTDLDLYNNNTGNLSDKQREYYASHQFTYASTGPSITMTAR